MKLWTKIDQRIRDEIIANIKKRGENLPSLSELRLSGWVEKVGDKWRIEIMPVHTFFSLVKDNKEFYVIDENGNLDKTQVFRKQLGVKNFGDKQANAIRSGTLEQYYIPGDCKVILKNGGSLRRNPSWERQ